MRAVTGKIFHEDYKFHHPFTAILTGSSGVSFINFFQFSLQIESECFLRLVKQRGLKT